MRRLYGLQYHLQMCGIKIGRLKADVVDNLNKAQQNWLVSQAVEMGCSSVAEYVTEMIRDEYEHANASAEREAGDQKIGGRNRGA